MIIRIIQKIFKLISIFLIAFLIYLGIQELYPIIAKLDIKNIGSIITGAITLIVGLGAVLLSQNKIKKRELDDAHRENKIEVYNRFNDKIFELFAGSNENVTGENPSEQNLIDFMMEFKKDIMFRASPKVIKSFIKFEQNSNKENKEKSVLRLVDDIYRAMRADIGLSNFGLDNLEMITIFLKDKSEKWKIK
jgi:hypothetical protein